MGQFKVNSPGTLRGLLGEGKKKNLSTVFKESPAKDLGTLQLWERSRPQLPEVCQTAVCMSQ